jgi:hypothetical protein
LESDLECGVPSVRVIRIVEAEREVAAVLWVVHGEEVLQWQANGIQSVLFGMQNRIIGPHSACRIGLLVPMFGSHARRAGAARNSDKRKLRTADLALAWEACGGMEEPSRALSGMPAGASDSSRFLSYT